MKRIRLTKDQKIDALRAELLHDKTCYYGSYRSTHPEARAQRDIAKILGEPFSHKALEAEEREMRGGAFCCTGE